MDFSIFKALIITFIFYYNCCIVGTAGNPGYELEDRNITELQTSTLRESGAEESVTVANTDKCAIISCQNGGICKIIDNDTVCECPEAYKGYTCETHKCDGIKCRNRGTCKVNQGVAVCDCPEDYEGTICDRRKCEDIHCRNNGTCMVIAGKAKCICSGDYTGDRCDDVRDEICSRDQPNCVETGGSCRKKNDGENFYCSCPSATTYVEGTGCKVRECRYRLRNCEETGGICVSTKNKGIVCECPNGMEYNETLGCKVSEELCLKYKPHCEETRGFCHTNDSEEIECKCLRDDSYVNGIGCKVKNDECSDRKKNCIETGGFCFRKKDNFGYVQYACKCPEGLEYHEDLGCLVFDPCTFSKKCYNGGMCLTQGKTFKCICKAPYTGKFCGEIRDDACSRLNPNCIETGGFCDDSSGELECKCRKKDTVSYVKGKGCQVNECGYYVQRYCIETGGTCISTRNDGIVCRCPKGMEYGDDLGCQVRIGTCSRYIKNCEETGGICRTVDKAQIQCKCPWYATFNYDYGCEVSNNTCYEYEENCIKTGGSCIPTKYGEIGCECPNGMKYNETGCVAFDPCEDNPCLNEGKCISQGNQFRCVCKEPFTGSDCSSIIKTFDPCEDNPCQNEGTCISQGTQFRCVCKEPFTGKDCSSIINDPCSKDPCLNGGRCYVVGKNFECVCEKTFSGKYCEISSGSQTNTVFYLIIGILLCLLFISVASLICCWIRLRRK